MSDTVTVILPRDIAEHFGNPVMNPRIGHPLLDGIHTACYQALSAEADCPGPTRCSVQSPCPKCAAAEAAPDPDGDLSAGPEEEPCLQCYGQERPGSREECCDNCSRWSVGSLPGEGGIEVKIHVESDEPEDTWFEFPDGSSIQGFNQYTALEAIQQAFALGLTANPNPAPPDLQEAALRRAAGNFRAATLSLVASGEQWSSAMDALDADLAAALQGNGEAQPPTYNLPFDAETRRDLDALGGTDSEGGETR